MKEPEIRDYPFVDYQGDSGIRRRIDPSEIEQIVAKPMDTKPIRNFLLQFRYRLVSALRSYLYWLLVFTSELVCGEIISRLAGAFPIVNFVFWVGIGHAGTLISAILFLLRQRWRTGIARFAEAMTIFAVMCAGIFPLIHIGRPWLAGYLIPYPNQHGTLG